MGMVTYPPNPFPPSSDSENNGGGGGGGSSLPNYSTEEQKTGQKWIDGKDIYVKVFSNLSTALVAGQAVDTTVDISSVSKILYGFSRSDDEITYVPTAIYKINNTLQLLGYQTGNVIKTVILYYTKTEV